MISKIKKISPLLIIIAVAFFFRFFQIGSLPISLFGDEVDVGYHAWSLWSTGKDYLGNFFPAYIHSLSEWRAPLLMYVTAPFVGLLGQNPLAVRLPEVILGTASIYLLYLLVKKLFQNEKRALISSFVLAITPWHLHYSRSAFEVVLLLFLEMLGTLLFISGYTFTSFIPFILTFYTYSTANIFTPLLVLSLLLIYRPKIWSANNFPKFLPPLLLTLPIAYHVLFGAAAGRFKLISIFNDQKIIDSVILNRTDPWVQRTTVETLFHNKYLAHTTEFAKNYLESFSPQFLFLNGDPNFRQSVGGFGELLIVSSPFLIIGFYLLLKDLSAKSHRLIFFWLLLSPLASSLTQGGGMHATRLFLMLTPLAIITAFGLEFVFNKIKNKLFVIILFAIFTLNFVSFWHRYTSHYRFESAAVWQHGYEQAFTALKPLLQPDSKVYINNTYSPSLIKFAFFTSFPPAKFHQDFGTDNQDSYDSAYFHGFQFGDKYFFGLIKDYSQMKDLLGDHDYYVAVQGIEIPGDWDWSKSPPENLKAISFKNIFNIPSFSIVSLKK